MQFFHKNYYGNCFNNESSTYNYCVKLTMLRKCRFDQALQCLMGIFVLIFRIIIMVFDFFLACRHFLCLKCKTEICCSVVLPVKHVTSFEIVF